MIHKMLHAKGRINHNVIQTRECPIDVKILPFFVYDWYQDSNKVITCIFPVQGSTKDIHVTQPGNAGVTEWVSVF